MIRGEYSVGTRKVERETRVEHGAKAGRVKGPDEDVVDAPVAFDPTHGIRVRLAEREAGYVGMATCPTVTKVCAAPRQAGSSGKKPDRCAIGRRIEVAGHHDRKVVP